MTRRLLVPTDVDGVATADALLATGLGTGGFTLPGRFLGVRSSTGPPTTGTFLAGDYGFDSAGTLWFCTAAGTPGTWLDLSSGRELLFADSTTVQSGVQAVVDRTGLTGSVEVGSRPVMVHYHEAISYASAAATGQYQITDHAGTPAVKQTRYITWNGANAFDSTDVFEHLTVPGTYNRKARFGRNGGAAQTLTAGLDGTTVSFLRAVEC